METKGNENISIDGNGNKVVHLHIHVEHLEVTELAALVEKLKHALSIAIPLPKVV